MGPAAVVANGRALIRRLFPRRKKRKLPGSGLPARRVIRTLRWARRIVQAVSLAVFLFFLAQTAFRGSFSASTDTRIRLPWPVEGFLLIDPYVAVMTFLSTHTVYRGLYWSLGLIGLTLIFRPGVLRLDLSVWDAPPLLRVDLAFEQGTWGKRIAANKTYPRQRVKYYLLYGFLTAAIAGSAIGGAFDPICIMVRSVGLAVIPFAQRVTGSAHAAVQDHAPRDVVSIADSTQDYLAHTVWQSKPFYYHHTWLIGMLFVAIVVMNRFIPRFWCRVLSPSARSWACSPGMPFSAWRRTTPSAPIATCVCSTVRGPTPRRAVSSGARTSATCASTARPRVLRT